MFQKIKQFAGQIFLHQRFYLIWAVITLFLFLGYWLPVFYSIGKYAFIVFVLFTLFDFIYLFQGGQITAHRFLPEKLSNGDDNIIKIDLKSSYHLPVALQIIDELPAQFQKRDFNLKLTLNPNEERQQTYNLRPMERGEYNFGKLNIFVESPLKLAKIRHQFEAPKTVKVYPSFIQMRKYEMMALSNKTPLGIKKVRRIGHTLEFEQIKNYQKGDDYRTINWKATAKHQKLMVNQYQDQTAQNVYTLIDMGRQMALPFNGMTLLDYAINASLSFMNIVIKKKDKAGLLTFEKHIHTLLKPDHSRAHLQQIFESLYAQKTRFHETDFERLYHTVRHHIPNRSLLMLYTNFEHINTLERQLPFLKRIAKKHLLVVVIFKNTELSDVIEKPADDVPSLYHKIVVEDFDLQKQLMIKKLQLHHIHTILTKPEDLTMQSINKYLKLKAKGLI